MIDSNRKSWNSLSTAEKADIMKMAIGNGIYNLEDIKGIYKEFAEGGKIHIDPSKKGTFTAAASRHGKSVQEFASQVLAHPENYSPAMRKKANFARNSARWHGHGGHLFGLGDHLYTANSEGVYMPEVSVYAPDLSKPRQYFVGYDENANPIYTTNYQESQEYLQNNQPKTEQEKEREVWKAENLNSQGTTYPGLQGDAADIAKLAEVGIGLPIIATNPVGAAAGNLAIDFATDLWAHPIMNGVGFATSYLGGKADESLGVTEAVNNSLPKNQQLPDGAIGEFVGYPLGRFSKEIGTGAVKAADWAARKAYAPYDFYRTIGETTLPIDDFFGTSLAHGAPTYDVGMGTAATKSAADLTREVYAPYNSYRTIPEITEENAFLISPEQWTAAQDAAIARGDIVEAQRLRDLHFKVYAPDTQIIDKQYHGSPHTFNVFDPAKRGNTDQGWFGKGYYFTPSYDYAHMYGEPRAFYINAEDVYTKGAGTAYFGRESSPQAKAWQRTMSKKGKAEEADDILDELRFSDAVRDAMPQTKPYNGIFEEVVTRNNNQMKLADAVTYDDKGVRIPLGLRDNFKLNDIRYGLLPFAALSGVATAASQKALGGHLYGRGSYGNHSTGLKLLDLI